MLRTALRDAASRMQIFGGIILSNGTTVGVESVSGRMPVAYLNMASRALSSHKATTGIVGLPLDEHARKHLTERLHEIMDSLKSHGIPETAAYRTGLEETCQAKLKALGNESYSDEQLEEMFGRQLEQEIKMSLDELSLIPKMAEWKPWEVPADHKIEITEEEDIVDEGK
eukprot:jgi/Picsp_1/3253/NSC_06093-R1_mitochondrial nadh:ubiquinone oxidoreductase 19 kda subunit